jgi:hypothetical protein
MVNLAEDYTRSLYKQHRMFAAWTPNLRFELGDFGTLVGQNNSIFNRYGNIATTEEFPKIQFKTRTASSPKSTLTYTSKDIVEYNFRPEGQVGAAGAADIVKGKLDISFSGSGGIFFYAENITVDSIDDKGSLFKEVISHYRNGYWKKNYALVTDIVKAGNTTICISGGNDASATFEARVPEIVIPAPSGVSLNLGNAGIQLGLISKKNIGYDMTSEPGHTPFMTLYGVKEKWWPPFDLRAEQLTSHLTNGSAFLGEPMTTPPVPTSPQKIIYLEKIELI